MSQTDTNRPLASSYVASEQQSVAGTTTHAAGTAKPLSEFATDTFMRSSGTFSPTRTSGVHTRTSGVHTSTAAVPTTTYTTAGYTSTIPTSYTAEYTSTAVPTSYTAAEYTSTAVPTTYTTTYANVPGLTGLTGSGTYATYGTTTTEELLKRSGASGYGATGAHHGLATSGYGGTGTHGGLATSGSYSYTHQTHGTIPAGSYTQGVPGGTYTTSAYTTPSHHHDLHQVTSQSIYKPSGSFEVHAVPYTSSSQIQSEAIKRTTITTRTSDSPSKRRELKQSLLLAPYRSTMYPEFENVEELPDRRNLVDSINFLLIRSAGKEALLSSPNKVSIKRQSVLSPAEIEFENIFREKYEDGTVYEGGAKHGTKHGKGKLTYKDGRVFEGEFQLGRAVGTGILRYKTGKVCYEGGFNDTVFEGQGVLQSETPIPLKGGFNFRNLNNVENHWIKYEGEFRNGKKHGRGTLHLTNGEKFVGDWRDDQISGRGQYHVLDGQVIEGQWDNGVWRE